ncbi:hypothetical protein HDV02_002132 [Globomyces sp. JEL0801]|nr:hypothetical protein HDV02_002132 [Globomyces sp. JEL0801]
MIIDNTVCPIIDEEEAYEKVKYIIDVFQNQRTNKHLIYVLVDLILVHVVPETASLQPNLD